MVTSLSSENGPEKQKSIGPTLEERNEIKPVDDGFTDKSISRENAHILSRRTRNFLFLVIIISLRA